MSDLGPINWGDTPSLDALLTAQEQQNAYDDFYGAKPSFWDNLAGGFQRFWNGPGPVNIWDLGQPGDVALKAVEAVPAKVAQGASAAAGQATSNVLKAAAPYLLVGAGVWLAIEVVKAK